MCRSGVGGVRAGVPTAGGPASLCDSPLLRVWRVMVSPGERICQSQLLFHTKDPMPSVPHQCPRNSVLSPPLPHPRKIISFLLTHVTLGESPPLWASVSCSVNKGLVPSVPRRS